MFVSIWVSHKTDLSLNYNIRVEILRVDQLARVAEDITVIGSLHDDVLGNSRRRLYGVRVTHRAVESSHSSDHGVWENDQLVLAVLGM